MQHASQVSLLFENQSKPSRDNTFSVMFLPPLTQNTIGKQKSKGEIIIALIKY